MALRVRTQKRLTGFFLVLGGLAMVVGGIWFGAAHFNFVRAAERASGVVTKIVGKRGARGMTLYHPVVRFRPAEGVDEFVFTAKPGLWPSPFAVGDEVTVAYDPDAPEQAMIVSFWTLWFLPAAMAALGLACVFAGRDTLKKAP